MLKNDRKPGFRCVIFDLDGTLVDTIHDIALSMNAALRDNGFPPVPPADFYAKVGWGIKRLAQLCLPPDLSCSSELVDTIAAAATRIYSENPLTLSKPYPGMLELVATLRSRNIRTAVLTNKPDRPAHLIVQGLFPPASFDSICGDKPERLRKPSPISTWDILSELDVSPANTLFAGDSEVDIQTALASGCFPLGVSWGYRPRDTLEKAGAARIIEHPSAFLDLVFALNADVTE
ncbi:HAD family hydrolase [Breznakiellaceae bacterium SP9]